MKLYKNDKYLTNEFLSEFYYDKELGVIRKKSTGKIMKAKNPYGRFTLVVSGVMLNQDRVVCWMNGVEFTPSCEIVHLDGDKSNLHIDNLKVKPYSLPVQQPKKSKFVAKNDKYIPLVAHHFDYDPETGVISHKDGKPVTSTHHGYIVIMFKLDNFKHIRIVGHRLAMYLMGHDLQGFEVDHVDANRTNNKYENLRLVSRSLNRRNAAKPSNNTSGISGVCWHKKQRRWEIKIQKKTIGYHSDFFEACCVRKSAMNHYGFYTERHGVVNVKQY